MSATRNGKVRCDGCGRISAARNGYYRTAQGTAGHILPASYHTDLPMPATCDLCDDCGNDERKIQNLSVSR